MQEIGKIFQCKQERGNLEDLASYMLLVSWKVTPLLGTFHMKNHVLCWIHNGFLWNKVLQIWIFSHIFRSCENITFSLNNFTGILSNRMELWSVKSPINENLVKALKSYLVVSLSKPHHMRSTVKPVFLLDRLICHPL